MAIELSIGYRAAGRRTHASAKGTRENNDHLVSVAIRFDESTVAKINRIAEKQDVSFAQVVRDAVMSHLNGD